MADEVTTTRDAPKASSKKADDPAATINKHLDAARDAMVASGMPEGDAEAFLSAARPSGVSTAVGNLADLNRSSGLNDVVVSPEEEDRLRLAHKPDPDAPPQKGF